MFRTYEEYDAYQCEWEEKLPVCPVCGEKITDDEGYQLDGVLMCHDCAMDWLQEQAVDIGDWMRENT